MYFLGGTFCLIAFSCKFPTVRTVGLREVIMCAFPCVQIIVWKTARSSIRSTFFAAAAGHTVICNVAANPQLLERLEIIFSRSRVTIDVNMFFFVLQPTAEWLRCISLSRNHDSDPSALRSSNRTSVALITWLRMREHNIRDGGWHSRGEILELIRGAIDAKQVKLCTLG
jgi:hypothetical protein